MKQINNQLCDYSNGTEFLIRYRAVLKVVITTITKPTMKLSVNSSIKIIYIQGYNDKL